MSFMDQKPFVVTAVNVSWKEFHCKLCGQDFKVGDTVRFVYANGTKDQCTGNFFVCPTCDTPDVLTRAKESFTLAKKLAKQWNIYGPDWAEENAP